MSKKIILVLITILIIIISFLPVKQLEPNSSNNNSLIMDESIFENVNIVQQFKSKKNYDGLYFVIGTYMRVYNKGYIIAEITDEKNKIVFHKKISLKEITDSAPIYLKFNLKKNVEYTLTLKTKKVPKSEGFIFYVDDDSIEKMKYNNLSKDYGLKITYFKYKNEYLNIWYILFYIVILLLFHNFNRLGGKNEK